MILYHVLKAPEVGPRENATFHDLMAAVGYLLFQWSLLDRGLDEEIAALRRATSGAVAMPGRPRTVNERLAEWRALLGRAAGRPRADERAIASLVDRIQDCQRLRTLVATGFVDAADRAAEPWIVCAQGAWRPGGANETRMTAADLLGAIEAMERCRSEMAQLRGLGER